MRTLTLSEQARTILELMAEGYPVSEILSLHPHLSAADIASAAREALKQDDIAQEAAIPRSGKTNLRTYEVWTDKEDHQLQTLLAEGISIQEISAILERHPMNIRRRMAALGLA